MATDAIATSRGSSRRSGGRWRTVSSGRRRMETNGGPMHTYVVKCACTFLVQTGNADEARRRALAQVTAVGATCVEVEEFVLRPNAQVPGEPIDRRAR